MTDEPRDETPAGDTPAGEVPAKKTPAKKVPAKNVPAKKVPAEKAPAEKPPAKKAPAKRAPAKKGPAAEAPAAETPAEPAVDLTPAEPTPTEDSLGTRAASASAAAARRARRIGGRASGTTRTEPAEAAAADVAGDNPPEAAPEPESIFTKKTVAPAPVAVGSTDAAGDDTELGEPEPRTVIVTTIPAWLNWAPAAVLAVGALVMAVLLVVFSHGVWWGPDPKQVPSDKSPAAVREQVLAAAKTCVATANTYQYTDLDTYETKALACTTGEFTSQLRDTIDRLIKVNAPRLKSSQTAQINNGGIEAVTADGKQWTILLFGQLSVTNHDNKKPRTDPFAAQVRMDKVNGKWLIGALSTVSSPLS